MVFTSKFKVSEKYDAKIDKFVHLFSTIAFFEQAIFSRSLKKTCHQRKLRQTERLLFKPTFESMIHQINHCLAMRQIILTIQKETQWRFSLENINDYQVVLWMDLDNQLDKKLSKK